MRSWPTTQQQRDEYLELAKRTQADFENYRKRMAAEVQAASLRGRAELAAQVVGVIDNLERALAAAGVEPGGEQAPAEPLAEGFFLTYRELVRGAGARRGRVLRPARRALRPEPPRGAAEGRGRGRRPRAPSSR